MILPNMRMIDIGCVMIYFSNAYSLFQVCFGQKEFSKKARLFLTTASMKGLRILVITPSSGNSVERERV